MFEPFRYVPIFAILTFVAIVIAAYVLDKKWTNEDRINN